jgi:hypothetical protein
MNQEYSKIQKIVTALECPNSNDQIDELNQQLETYLNNIQKQENLSFWISVNMHYWSFMNLTKVLNLKFDIEYGQELKEFEEKVRQIQNDRLHSTSPRLQLKPLDVIKENSTVNNNDQNIQNDFKNDYLMYKIVGCTCLVILGSWITFCYYKKSNSQ